MKAYWEVVKPWLKAGLIRVGYHSKPKFLILGAQKAGTMSLFNHLTKHPNIIRGTGPGYGKEVGFFYDDENYRKGVAWYHDHFPLPHHLKQYNAITFEATPEYLYYPAVAERIFSYDPKMKFIVSIRDPIKRAFSAWNMFRIFGEASPDYQYYHLAEYRDFDECVRDEVDKIHAGNSMLEPSYVRRGFYDEQLLRYFNYFERGQFFIVDSRLLKSDTVSQLNQITQFLGLPEYDWQQVELPLINTAKYEQQINDETRDLLSELYKPHNKRLYELLEHDFGWQ